MLKLYCKFLKFLKPFTVYLILVFLGDLLVANFALIVPLFSRILFDYAYPLKSLFLLNAVILAGVVLYFIEFFINVMDDYLNTYVDQTYSRSLVQKIFDKCQRLPLSFHQRYSTGDLIQRFTDDVSIVVERTLSTVPQLVLQVYSLTSIFVVALLMNHKITLLALCSLPFYILETKFFARKAEELEEVDTQLQGQYFNILQERFDSIRTVKAFGEESQETSKVMKHRRLMSIMAVKQGIITILSVFANSVTIRMWSIFLGWYMGYLIIHNELTIGEIISLTAYVTMLGGPIQNLSSQYQSLRTSMVSFRRLDEILSAKTEAEQDIGKKDLSIKKGVINFEKVTFRYNEGERLILKSLSFHIRERSAVAIVGESGSGKTTAIALIMRFFSPESGAIVIDGQEITSVTLQSLRDQVGLVEQDYTLFAGTLRDNILYGSHNKSEAQLIDACRRAQIYDFIATLPDKFDTQIGFGGDGLSGGQKQRLAIARVLLKDPKIIIFDEATSSLDPESEYKITEVMNGLIGKKNLFIIAHRLSTIKKVDRILMLDGGQVVEEGSFQELLDKKGAFFRYYSMQFGGFDVFRKMLEIEYERVGRYGSKFNLIAVKLVDYAVLVDAFGLDEAKEYLEEVLLMIRRLIRKGDSAAYFYGDVIMLMLPEIMPDQVKTFFDRLLILFKDKKIAVGDGEHDVRLVCSCLHVETMKYKVVDDLMGDVVATLATIKAGDETLVRSITKAKND